MIEYIEVTGFKSLDSFALDIKPGLNVLVGPNGSGKTNILKFFEFLSFLSSFSIPEAVSKSGGAGAIFTRQVESEGISNKLSFKFSGFGGVQPRFYRHAANGEAFVEYLYEAEVELSDEGTTVSYKSQRLCASFFNHNRRSVRRKKGLTPIWHLEISAELKNHKVVLNKLKKDGRAIRRAFGSNSFMVPTFLIQDHYEFANYPLFSILQRYFDPVRKLSIDLERGQIYNINPEEVKKPEDIARPALIDHDGTGLAATIYSLQSVELASPYGPVYRELPGLHTRRRTVAQIMSVIKLVNSSISRIKVNSDALENQLKISAFVDSSMGEVEIPLSLLSDGTVKWLSLVTAIMTNESIFSIEEPENFLHPVMQKEIVAIIRSTGKSNQERFALMTTHSESLLNALDPSEVVVVSIAKARTQAIRNEDAQILRDEIERTGFGLGYYYISGALE